jgi:hypothetical protein
MQSYLTDGKKCGTQTEINPNLHMSLKFLRGNVNICLITQADNTCDLSFCFKQCHHFDCHGDQTLQQNQPFKHLHILLHSKTELTRRFMTEFNRLAPYRIQTQSHHLSN